MVNNFISSDGSPVNSNEDDGHQTAPIVEGPFEGGRLTGAHSPYPVKPGPELIDAVAFKANAYGSNMGQRDRFGYIRHTARHEQNAIFIDGVNIRDIIAGLTARIAALETP